MVLAFAKLYSETLESVEWYKTGQDVQEGQEGLELKSAKGGGEVIDADFRPESIRYTREGECWKSGVT